MKNIIILGVWAVLGLGSCSKNDSSSTTPSVSPITEQEKADLIFLREEEKFAHDVYVYANKKYNHMVFANISSSELKHTNAVLGLLNVYGIDDPAAGKPEGEFVNVDLQKLYNEFILTVDSSLEKAFYVGATIEDMDIHDIKRLKANTTKPDLLSVYDNLACGSRNHMRAFVGQLGSYMPQFISKEELDEILNGSHESCGK